MTIDKTEVSTAVDTFDIDAYIASIPRSKPPIEPCFDCGKRRRVNEYWLPSPSPSSFSPSELQATCRECTRKRREPRKPWFAH